MFSKLYKATVEPILFYGSGIWGTKSYNCVNVVQNKACKLFLGVGKYTFNLAVRGDMNWLSCLSKQKLERIRYLCKLIRLDDNNMLLKYVFILLSCKKNSWFYKVDKYVDELHAHDVIWDVSISGKSAITIISEKLKILDNNEWNRELFNDRKCTHGNKLRTYRNFKTLICLE